MVVAHTIFTHYTIMHQNIIINIPYITSKHVRKCIYSWPVCAALSVKHIDLVYLKNMTDLESCQCSILNSSPANTVLWTVCAAPASDGPIWAGLWRGGRCVRCDDERTIAQTVAVVPLLVWFENNVYNIHIYVSVGERWVKRSFLVAVMLSILYNN